MNNCKSTNTLCDFADKNGNCTQPDISLYHKCNEFGKSRKKLLSLEKKALKLKRKILKILDKIYEEDELFGDTVNEELQDEKFLRSKI